MLGVTQNTDIISFAGGLPAPWLFPLEELENAAARAMQNGKKLLQYSLSEGLAELREYICEHMQRKSGVKLAAENILITSGAQQGLDLLSRIFLESDTPLYLEKPTYPGAIQTFSFWQPAFQQVNLTDDKKEQFTQGSGLFYFMPNFQNPSGHSYSQKTREELAEIAMKKDLLLVEDDPYGELRYDSSDLPPLYSLCQNTVYLGSFSKTVAPGMRLGWIAAPATIMKNLIIAKQASDLHSSTLAQGVLLEYLKTANLDEHIGKIKKVYASSRDVMCETLKKELPQLEFSKPDGGMFVWCRLPQQINAAEFSKRALEHGVAVVFGNAFYFDGNGPECIRLNFSNQSHDNIIRGIKLLQTVFQEMINENVHFLHV